MRIVLIISKDKKIYKMMEKYSYFSKCIYNVLFLPGATHLEAARKHMETFHVIYCSK